MTKPAFTEIGAKPLPLETNSCWSCGSMRAAHFCESCGKVQPPAPVDYFSFFGLPAKLTIEVPALEKEFYHLSRKLHPDLSARAGSQEQEWSLEQSSLLNDAYRTLRDPIKRTQYLLRIEGVELEEQSKSATEQARATGGVKKQARYRQTLPLHSASPSEQNDYTNIFSLVDTETNSVVGTSQIRAHQGGPGNPNWAMKIAERGGPSIHSCRKWVRGLQA